MEKQVFTTSSPLVRKQRHRVYGFLEWLPSSIEALGNGVSNSIRAANTTETIVHSDVNVNENKRFSFTEIKTVGIALAAAAVIIAVIFMFRKG